MLRIWQAWQVLSNIQISSRQYIKPGKTVHVKEGNKFPKDVGKNTSQYSSGVYRNSSHTQSHQYPPSATNARLNEPTNCTSNYFPSGGMKAAEPGKGVEEQSQVRGSMSFSSHNQVPGGSFRNPAQTNRINEPGNGLMTDMDDDDDILEVINFARTGFEGFL